MKRYEKIMLGEMRSFGVCGLLVCSDYKGSHFDRRLGQDLDSRPMGYTLSPGHFPFQVKVILHDR